MGNLSQKTIVDSYRFGFTVLGSAVFLGGLVNHSSEQESMVPKKMSLVDGVRGAIRQLGARRLLCAALFFLWLLSCRTVFRGHGFGALTFGVDARAMLDLYLGASFIALTIASGLLRHAPAAKAPIMFAGAAGTLSALLAYYVAPELSSAALFNVFLAAAAFSMAYLVFLAFQNMLAADLPALCFGVIVQLLVARVAMLVLSGLPLPITTLIAVSIPLASAALLFGNVGMRVGSSLELLSPSFDKKASLVMAGLVLLGFAFGALKQLFRVPAEAVPLSVNFYSVVFYIAVIGFMLLRARSKSLFADVYRLTFCCVVLAALAYLSLGSYWSPVSLGVILGSQHIIMSMLLVIVPFVRLKLRERNVVLFGWAFSAFFLSNAFGTMAVELVSQAILSSAGNPVGMAALEVLDEMAPYVCAALAALALLVMNVALTPSDIVAFSASHESALAHDESMLAERCDSLARHAGLSAREREVLLPWVQGRTARQIAEEHVVSESTVRSHLYHVYTKTGAHNRDELSKLLESMELDD